MSTCSQCDHWHKSPADPRNLAAPAQGECRCTLNASPVVQQDALGRFQIAAWVTAYPPVSAEFQACGQFAARRLVEAENGST